MAGCDDKRNKRNNMAGSIGYDDCTNNMPPRTNNSKPIDGYDDQMQTLMTGNALSRYRLRRTKAIRL